MTFQPPFQPSRSASQTPARESPQDTALRPRRLDEFVGQAKLVENLRIAIQASRARAEPVDHILLSGLPGLGKTTLAEIVAHEAGTAFRSTSGPALEKPADLVGLLTSLNPRDVLFIDEIHRLPVAVEEYLYSAMEDFRIVILLDQGPKSRSVPVSVHPFTLIGATTREGLLGEPFRARFGIQERLEPYSAGELSQVVLRSAKLLGATLTPEGAALIAARSRGTPRLANRFLRRLRDLAEVQGSPILDVQLAREGLARLGLDDSGLLPLDRRLLGLLRDARDQAVGLKTLAVALGEEERTIEDVYEPFLIREGLVARTPRGRILTERGREVLLKTASDAVP
jgi:Holliday junction DNA helicase RuvB